MQDLYCFLEPYVDDICRVAVVQMSDEGKGGHKVEATSHSLRGAENNSHATQIVRNNKTCIIDFKSKV